MKHTLTKINHESILKMGKYRDLSITGMDPEIKGDALETLALA